MPQCFLSSNNPTTLGFLSLGHMYPGYPRFEVKTEPRRALSRGGLQPVSSRGLCFQIPPTEYIKPKESSTSTAKQGQQDSHAESSTPTPARTWLCLVRVPQVLIASKSTVWGAHIPLSEIHWFAPSCPTLARLQTCTGLALTLHHSTPGGRQATTKVWRCNRTRMHPSELASAIHP